MSETKVFMDKYKNADVFAIYEVDENDRKKYDYPVVSFGRYKAKVICDHIDDIFKFAQSEPEYGRQPNRTIPPKTQKYTPRNLFDNDGEIPF